MPAARAGSFVAPRALTSRGNRATRPAVAIAAMPVPNSGVRYSLGTSRAFSYRFSPSWPGANPDKNAPLAAFLRGSPPSGRQLGSPASSYMAIRASRREVGRGSSGTTSGSGRAANISGSRGASGRSTNVEDRAAGIGTVEASISGLATSGSGRRSGSRTSSM